MRGRWSADEPIRRASDRQATVPLALGQTLPCLEVAKPETPTPTATALPLRPASAASYVIAPFAIALICLILGTGPAGMAASAGSRRERMYVGLLLSVE